MSEVSVPVPYGWMRYVVFVDVPAAPYDESDDASSSFVATSMALPRVGEELVFDGPGNTLELVVTAVSHSFTTAAGSKPYGHLVTVETQVVPGSETTARLLYENSEEKDRWISLFPMVEPRFPSSAKPTPVPSDPLTVRVNVGRGREVEWAIWDVDLLVRVFQGATATSLALVRALISEGGSASVDRLEELTGGVSAGFHVVGDLRRVCWRR
ncbi:hypothetical protein [Nocardia sp. NPDC049526]|uniref:hypothetical protein n=1 Tax=Nocardia sp. NPDC049526 TaxID=3364316 RepID=UPI0037BBD935